jgi:hypothetical protein
MMRNFIVCEISLMCFMTIAIVTNHTDLTPEDEDRLFLKRTVCVICDNGNSPKTY